VGARILVRHAGTPIGIVELPAPRDVVMPETLTDQIWATLGPQITARHLALGLDVPTSLSLFGLAGARTVAPTMAKERISVVIATRDRPALLLACLLALAESDHPNFEVIVVYNAPTTDASRRVVDQLADRLCLRYVVHPTPGSSAARNAGLRVADAPLVAFTDDDVRVDSRWLSSLGAAFGDDLSVQCVTGLVVPAELDTEAQVWFEQFGGFNKGFIGRRFDMEANRVAGALYPYSPGAFGSGNNSAFRRETLLRLGGFDERLGPGTPARGGEDLDLFLEVVVGGGTLVYEPSAIVHHVHRREYKDLRRQVHDYGVGLSALLTKWATRDVRGLVEIGRRVPAGVAVLLRSDSAKNVKKAPTFPTELTRLELRGVVGGPLAFARSAWKADGFRGPRAHASQLRCESARTAR
jgi:GT2 family glycosyltransferase